MKASGKSSGDSRGPTSWVSRLLLWVLPAGLFCLPVVANDAHSSKAQIQRGAATFDQVCSRCHSKNLSGGQGPALKSEAFVSEWNGKPARAIYSRILLTMPLDDPGTLTPTQAMDLVAFIVSVNGFKDARLPFTSPEQMGKVTLQGRQ